MSGCKKVSFWCVIVLMSIAWVVFIGLLNQDNMWLYIVAYWLVLTIKNLADYLEHLKKREEG